MESRYSSSLIINFLLTVATFSAVYPPSMASSALNKPTFRINHVLQKMLPTFHNCELVFVEPKLTDLQNTAIHPSSSTTFKTSERQISFNDFSFSDLNQESSGAHSASVEINITFPRHEDIHRYTHEHCSIGVILLHSFDQNVETWLVKTLIPRYAPILRKDIDHFLLVLPNEEIADKILVSPRFGSKIKYKLAIYQVPSGRLTCKTVDLYGNEGYSALKVLQTFGVQELSDGNFDTTNLFPDFTSNFNGKVFRFAIPKVAFRFEIELRKDGKYHPKRGFYKWWLDEAMNKFNFTYDIFWASFGGGTGKKLKNGTWVGATGDMYYGKADCSFIVGEIYSRHKFLGWSSSISYEWVIFMTHIPRNSYSPKAIFKPFTPLMWILFFLTLVIMTLALKSLAMNNYDPESVGIQWKYGKMFEYMYCTLMEQDMVCPLNSHSIRVLCTFWLLFAIVTATAYRGKLVSLIAFPVNTWVPSTFEELANSDFKVALNVVGKAGAAYVLIATSTSPVFKKLTARMELISEPENCLERAMREDMGCIIWKGIADYAKVKHLTDKHGHVPLQESTQIALFIGDGLVYERRAIFGEHLDRTIQAVVQMGLTIKWLQLDEEFIKRERKIYEKSKNVTQVVYDYDDGPKKLVVSQFTGLFLLTFLCYLISGGRLIYEIVHHRRKRAAQEDHFNLELKIGNQREKDDSDRGSALTLGRMQTTAKFAHGHVNEGVDEKLITSAHNPHWHYTKY